MGYLRFGLAFCVLYSHTPFSSGLNIGVVAVIVFYMLAGFVMAHLYFNIFAQTPNRIKALLKDRFLRIYPLYCYALMLCIVFVCITDYHNPQFSLTNLAAHFLIIPLNYFMFFDFSVLQNPKLELNHLTFSLAIEIQAYGFLILCFMFTRLLWIMFSVSIIIFIFSVGGILDADLFGYRLLCGVFFVFIFGSLLQQTKGHKKYILACGIGSIAVLIFSICKILKIGLLPYSREVLLGVCIAPFLVLFFHIKFINTLAGNKLFGALSYGLFLSHTPSIWILDYLAMPKNSLMLYIFNLSFISIIIALFGIYAIERPLNMYYKRKQ